MASSTQSRRHLYQIARDVGLTSRALRDAITSWDIGLDASNHMKTFDAAQEAEIKARLAGASAGASEPDPVAVALGDEIAAGRSSLVPSARKPPKAKTTEAKPKTSGARKGKKGDAKKSSSKAESKKGDATKTKSKKGDATKSKSKKGDATKAKSKKADAKSAKAKAKKADAKKAKSKSKKGKKK